jgi:hypothetical protein
MFIWHEHAHNPATLGRQLSLVLSGIAKGRGAGLFAYRPIAVSSPSGLIVGSRANNTQLPQITGNSSWATWPPSTTLQPGAAKFCNVEAKNSPVCPGLFMPSQNKVDQSDHSAAAQPFAQPLPGKDVVTQRINVAQGAPRSRWRCHYVPDCRDQAERRSRRDGRQARRPRRAFRRLGALTSVP